MEIFQSDSRSERDDSTDIIVKDIQNVNYIFKQIHLVFSGGRL